MDKQANRDDNTIIQKRHVKKNTFQIYYLFLRNGKGQEKIIKIIIFNKNLKKKQQTEFYL